MAAGMHGPDQSGALPTYEQVRAESLAQLRYIDDLTAINERIQAESERVQRENERHRRRQRAVMALMRYPVLSTDERVGVLGLLRYLYARRGEPVVGADGAVWVDYNRAPLVEQTGLSLSTLARVVRSCVAYGWLQRRERLILVANMYPITQPSLLLPAPSLTEALELAATWTKPADAPRHGGRRLRCLDCGSERVITQHTCQDCGSHHVDLVPDEPRQPAVTLASVQAAPPVRPGGAADDLRTRRRGWNPDGDPSADLGG